MDLRFGLQLVASNLRATKMAHYIALQLVGIVYEAVSFQPGQKPYKIFYTLS